MKMGEIPRGIDKKLFDNNKLLGKSFLTAIFCHVKCVLMPNTKVVICSGVLSQGAEIVKYVDSFRNMSDATEREISFLSDNKNNLKIDYYNGSSIRVVTASNSSRGARSNLLVVDEYVLVPWDIISMVLRKFKASTRYCGYLKKPEYKGKFEKNSEIYLSSAFWKSHWSYKHFLSFVNMMKNGHDKYFVCTLPYQMSIYSGLRDISEIQDEMNEDTYDPQKFAMEMEGRWMGEEDGDSWFKWDSLEACRRINMPIYPMYESGLISKDDKAIKKQEKKKDEIRILSVDCARKAGIVNDATAITLIICEEIKDPKTNTSFFLRKVPFVTTMVGTNTLIQALEIRRLYEELSADRICIDAQNIGAGIIDALSMPMRDPDTNKEYSPLGVINHDDLNLGEELYKNVEKVIYGVNGSPKLNSEIAYLTKDLINKRRVHFLIDETEGRRVMAAVKGVDELSPDAKASLISPFSKCYSLLNEMVGLEYTLLPDSNLIKLREKAGNRKDMYSSLSYGLYYTDKLEKELLRQREEFEFDEESLIETYIF